MIQVNVEPVQPGRGALEGEDALQEAGHMGVDFERLDDVLGLAASQLREAPSYPVVRASNPGCDLMGRYWSDTCHA